MSPASSESRGRYRLLASVAVLLLVLPCCGYWGYEKRATRRAERLLDGDESLRFRRFGVSGHGQEFEVQRPESLAYLTAAFRQAVKEGHVPSHTGTSWLVRVSFGSCSSTQLALRVPEDGSGLTVGVEVAFGDDLVYYWVAFPEPMPSEVHRMLGLMR